MARRIVRRSAGQRSLKTWSGIQQANGGPIYITPNVSGSAGIGIQTIFFAIPEPETRDVIVLWTRGSWHAMLSGLVADESISIAMGFGIVTNEAAAVSSVPEVMNNPSWDGWYSWQMTTLTGSDPTNSPLSAVASAMDFDSKAMRKVSAGNSILIAVQTSSNTNIGGATGLSVVVGGRILLKTS